MPWPTPRAFLLKKRGVALEDADDRAIWHAIFTIRRKAQAERKKKRGGASAADVLANVLGGKVGKSSRQVDPERNPF